MATGTIGALCLLGTAAGTAQAQSTGSDSRTDTGALTPSRFISTNPFLPLFGYFSAEYEQRVKSNVAFAISASHVKFDEKYTNVDAKLRLYPNDKALEGFSIASSVGIAWIERDGQYVCDFTAGGICATDNGRNFSTPSFAIEIGYQWLLGRSKSTAVTAGFGAKRYLTGTREDYLGVNRVVPTGRISIGYGF